MSRLLHGQAEDLKRVWRPHIYLDFHKSPFLISIEMMIEEHFVRVSPSAKAEVLLEQPQNVQAMSQSERQRLHASLYTRYL